MTDHGVSRDGRPPNGPGRPPSLPALMPLAEAAVFLRVTELDLDQAVSEGSVPTVAVAGRSLVDVVALLKLMNPAESQHPPGQDGEVPQP